MTYAAPSPPRSPRWVPILVVVLVLSLVGAGFGIWLFLRALAGPPPLADQVVWSVPDGDAMPSASAEKQAWTTGDVVISAVDATGRFTALAKTDGSERWTYQLPAPQGEDGEQGAICFTSHNVADGTLAVVYRPTPEFSPCVGLLLLDLETGKPRWNVRAPDEGDGLPSRLTAVGVAGNVVAVTMEEHGAKNHDVVAGLSMATGAQVWLQDTGCVVSRPGLAAGARRVVLASQCWDGAEVNEVRTFDPATGRELSRLRTDRFVRVLYTEPLALYDHEVDEVSVLAEDGRRVATRFEASVGLAEFGDQVSVVDNRFVLYSKLHGWSAWDLRSGDRLWTRETWKIDGETVLSPEPVRTGPDEIVVKAGRLRGVALIRIDPGTGEGTVLRPMVTDEDKQVDFSGTWFWDGRRLYVVNPDDRGVLAAEL